jgi:hypothetical protein
MPGVVKGWRAPIEIGRKERMKEPHIEGLVG